MDFIRQGYDVRCQLRPHSSIVHGPVMLEIHDFRELVVTLLELLLQPASSPQVSSHHFDSYYGFRPEYKSISYCHQ